MSDPRASGTMLIEPNDWNEALRRLRDDGFSPVESIKVTRAVLGVALGEAKAIVHGSPAWSDSTADFEHLHAAAEAAIDQL